MENEDGDVAQLVEPAYPMTARPLHAAESEDTTTLAPALSSSLTYIDNALNTSIGFEGMAMALLVDEFQFNFNPGCVVLESPTGTVANALPEEVTEIGRYTRRFPWVLQPNGRPNVQISYKAFPALRSTSRDKTPLRRAIAATTSAYRVRVAGSRGPWTLTAYYTPERIPSEFCQDPDALAWYTYEAVQLASSGLYERRRTQPAILERLHHHFAKSAYLERILEKTADRIREQLSEHHREFEYVARTNPFFLQFFIVHGPKPGRRHELRFFPLETQREALAHPAKLDEIRDALERQRIRLRESPSDFISDYLWDADRSFVGYCADVGASLYLPDWKDEPRAKGVHLGKTGHQERKTATIIMDVLRGKTAHIFTIPIFAGRQVIGAVAINSAKDVDPATRLSAIRSLRGTGFPLSLALEMDEVVNRIAEQKRQLAQERAYKDIAFAIFHEDQRFAQTLGTFLAELDQRVSDPVSFATRMRFLQFFLEDKLSLYREFRTQQHSPIDVVDESVLYPSLQDPRPEVRDLSLADMQAQFDTIKDIYAPRSTPTARPPITVRMKWGNTLKAKRKIPNFDVAVFSRIIANLVSNSRRVADERELSSPQLDIVVDLMTENGRRYIAIVAQDNCGGFTDERHMPKEITVDSWTTYRSDKDNPGGMGYLLLARYAAASGGTFHRETLVRGKLRGARVVLTIGLKNNGR
jgi:hypothetical protein